MFVTKEKFHFSLICSCYCCLVEEGWALKVAWQFAIQKIVAYKSAVYEKSVFMLDVAHGSCVSTRMWNGW